jgi:hypothetical protein
LEKNCQKVSKILKRPEGEEEGDLYFLDQVQKWHAVVVGGIICVTQELKDKQ